MMDYNLWHAFNDVRDEPDRAAELTASTLATYWAAYRSAAAGNRAPLVVANHFNDWSGGAFSHAAEEFLAQVCGEPATVCATYTEVIAWMSLQDPVTLAPYRAMARHQLSREQAFDALRIASQNTNKKLRDIAVEVGDTGVLSFGND